MTPDAVDYLVLRMIITRRYQRLESAIRRCARSLRAPAGTTLISSLNRLHEHMARQIAAQPEFAALLGEPHATARAAGFPRWDGDPHASLAEIMDVVRQAGRSLPQVH
jgi:hypothetical protein